MLRGLCLFLVALGTSINVSAVESDLLQNIADRLVAYDSIEGEFRQSKKLSFMVRPLVSSGFFSLDSSSGLRWLVEEPLRSEMIVVGASVTLDGEPVRDRGVGQFMANIMRAFMVGDLVEVQRDFELGEIMTEMLREPLAEADSEKPWHLNLVPSSVLMRQVLSNIELRGDDFLRSISIEENNGNVTLIEFNKVSGLPSEKQVQDARRP